MAANLAAEVTNELTSLGRMVTQLGKHYGGVVFSDIKATVLPDAFSKGLRPRQKTDDELCRTCQKLNLVKLFNDMKPGLDSLDVRFLLGTYDDIVARSYCPFCRLVLSAVNNSLRYPVSPRYRTPEGEAICCLLRRREASSRFLWQRNLKIELRSIPAKSVFSKTRLYWRLGWENDMGTDNNYLKDIVQECDAEIIVHNDSTAKYPFPQTLDQNDKNNYSTKGNRLLGLKASHKAGWWLDPIPMLGCTPEPTFDVQKLLAWHKFCSDCNVIDLISYDPTRLVAIAGMLLIDISTMNLVPAPARVAYVALSYVWGKLKDPFRATKANRDELMAKGGLVKVTLPRTIEESIRVIKAIGFRYFWVDSICIIQDDPESLMGHQSDGYDIRGSISHSRCSWGQ